MVLTGKAQWRKLKSMVNALHFNAILLPYMIQKHMQKSKMPFDIYVQAPFAERFCKSKAFTGVCLVYVCHVINHIKGTLLLYAWLQKIKLNFLYAMP